MSDPGDFGALGPGGWDDELGEQCWFLASPTSTRYRNNIELNPEDVATQVSEVHSMVVSFEAVHGIEFATQARSKPIPILVAEATETVRAGLEQVNYDASELGSLATAANLLASILVISDESFPAETRAHLRSPHLLLTWLERFADESKMAAVRPFQPAGADTFVVRLNKIDKATIKRALERVSGAGETDDPSIKPLFPDPYEDDAEKNDGWNALVRGELIESRSNAVADAASTIGAPTVSTAQVNSLMRCLNDARLMMGVELNITDEEDRTQAMKKPIVYAQFERLGYLVAMCASALQTSL